MIVSTVGTGNYRVLPDNCSFGCTDCDMILTFPFNQPQITCPVCKTVFARSTSVESEPELDPETETETETED